MYSNTPCGDVLYTQLVIKPTTPEPHAAENISMRYSKLFYTLHSKQRPKS